MSAWDAVTSAFSEARAISYAADKHARQMADLLLGRLRHVDSSTLVKLKRELRDFDATTRTWK